MGDAFVESLDITIIRDTPRLVAALNAELVRRRERDKKALLAPPVKHPLLCPPFVKVK